MLCKSLYEYLVFNHSRLWKSVHYSSDFTHDESIYYFIYELIFIDDLLWDDVDL